MCVCLCVSVCVCVCVFLKLLPYTVMFSFIASLCVLEATGVTKAVVCVILSVG